MGEITNAIVYIFLFLSLNFEVFLLITYFEKREEIKTDASLDRPDYPEVTIMVPVWNEENTVAGTVHSLLNLDYPKEKLRIMVIDDGSTDGTQAALAEFAGNPQIEMARKENGGKHSALNYGLERISTPFVGCLDADSFVNPDALKQIIPYFDNPEMMAVVPSTRILKPTKVIHWVQNIEFLWGIFIRKMLSFNNALYVTPGPFSIFRKKVFDDLGPYRHAHNTEDLEIALRMQTHHYKIVNAHKAYVYTVPMKNVYRLYRQRLRWTSGFLSNAIDYRHLYFSRKHGALGLFILPMATITIFSALYFTTMSIIVAAEKLGKKIVEFNTIGFTWNLKGIFSFDWFYINTESVAFIGIIMFALTFVIILIAKTLSKDRVGLSKDMIYFLAIYTFIAPFWLAKAVYNVLLSRKTTWR